ncbi:MAG TPA: TIGR02996 domain-containing protein [Gemmata sp.]
MSDEERALVTAIQAAPDENTARLAYADWLDENGTTDQQRARSEWIRLTCNDRSKRTQMPTGRQVRKAGEPAWLRANANRLWPNLMRFESARGLYKTVPILSMGRITFMVPLEVPRQRGGSSLEQSSVVLTAERGVATVAEVGFLRAALVAPAVARDEPAAPIRFAGVPVRCYERGPRRVTIPRRPFAIRGLVGVWEAIELEPSGSTAAPIKVLTVDGKRTQPVREFELRLYAALTKWAREQAALAPAPDAQPPKS